MRVWGIGRIVVRRGIVEKSGSKVLIRASYSDGYNQLRGRRWRSVRLGHPALKRQDRLGKEPFAGFGTVVEDITESGYTKNQPILLGAF